MLKELEKQMWDMLLSDPHFIENKDEIVSIDAETFEERYEILKEHFIELEKNSKVGKLMLSIMNDCNVNKELYIFQGDFIKGVKQAGIHDFSNSIILIISSLLVKSYTEMDLLPILAHELGHIVNTTPYTPPYSYFIDRLVSKNSSKAERRLFILSSYINNISEYRADQFALEYVKNYEQVVNSLLKLELKNSKKKIDTNIYKILRDFIKIRKSRKFDYADELIDDHPSIGARMFYLLEVAKKNDFVFSQSLKDMELNYNVDQLLQKQTIIDFYKESL